LKKLDAGDYDAIILAAAGLTRLGWADRITERLDRSLMIPAVGQGALGLETRSADELLQQILLTLDHPASHLAVLAERSMLATLRGGCLAPVGGWGRIDEQGQLQLTGTVLSPDGVTRLLVQEACDLPMAIDSCTTHAGRRAALQLGEAVALQLIQSGAERLIAAARE
jgi:hydroxymethylbilane synthase